MLINYRTSRKRSQLFTSNNELFNGKSSRSNVFKMKMHFGGFLHSPTGINDDRRLLDLLEPVTVQIDQIFDCAKGTIAAELR